MNSIIFFAFLGFNLFTFLLMGYDKRQASNNGWRIPENRFFLYSLVGGSLGVLAGMPVWKHKRQKFSFKSRIYGILLLQIALGAWLRPYLF